MKSSYPVVQLTDNQPLNEFFCDVNQNRYSVARLVEMCKDLTPFDCPLAVMDLSGQIWAGSDMMDFAFHFKKCIDADLSKPIIIAWDGTIADGRHRVIKALAEGRATIKAVRMSYKPEPCRYSETN